MGGGAGIWKQDWPANHRVVIMPAGGVVPGAKMNEEVVSGMDGDGAFLPSHG